MGFAHQDIQWFVAQNCHAGVKVKAFSLSENESRMHENVRLLDHRRRNDGRPAMEGIREVDKEGSIGLVSMEKDEP